MWINKDKCSKLPHLVLFLGLLEVHARKLGFGIELLRRKVANSVVNEVIFSKVGMNFRALTAIVMKRHRILE